MPMTVSLTREQTAALASKKFCVIQAAVSRDDFLRDTVINSDQGLLRVVAVQEPTRGLPKLLICASAGEPQFARPWIFSDRRLEQLD